MAEGTFEMSLGERRWAGPRPDGPSLHELSVWCVLNDTKSGNRDHRKHPKGPDLTR